MRVDRKSSNLSEESGKRENVDFLIKSAPKQDSSRAKLNDGIESDDDEQIQVISN